MRDLLDNEDSFASTVLVWPDTVEKLSQNWVQWLSWLALAAQIRPAGGDSPFSRSPSFHFGSMMVSTTLRRYPAQEEDLGKYNKSQRYSQCIVP